LLHRPGQLLEEWGVTLYDSLLGLKRHGLVEQIGVSVYRPEELDMICPHYALDVVQAPLNVVDRRLAKSGWLQRLRGQGTEIHIRSIFLQGVLLMGADVRPASFDAWRSLWSDWDAWLAQEHLAPLQACVAYALSHAEVDRIVIGVDTGDHLREILLAAGSSARIPPEALACDDPDLVDPSRWKSS
jgi:aryl-alcohol dehydrogenase-like predicted oxidoreductase